MERETLLLIAGVIFLLVALMHLVRVIFKVRITVADRVVPVWISVFGFAFAALLAIATFSALR